MAFGFPAYHEEDATLPQPVTHEWIAHACAANGCAPPTYQMTRNGAGVWRTGKSVSMLSWGESIAITWLAPNVIRVRSECAMPTQCWGKNAKNVHAIVSTLLAGMGAR